ncbi:MAG: DNA mismatch repair endonuclease MutL [Pyrinomonadaceae bacterium]
MPQIRVLPDSIANQIAAGEVVERPASVVKELVENSIDAGSSKISIEIEMGGRRLIKVTDDGCGIAPDEALLAFERHATSKLNTIEELESIRTLGFRGEALASIASVAKIELTTKTKSDETALQVTSEDGKSFETSETGRITGTTIAVRDLFHNVPARRKFLRSQPTENYHISSIITHYALANPSIAFTLVSNGRESIRVSPARTLRERAFQLFGGELIESLIPVESDETGYLDIEGFVSAPRTRRTSRDSQYFFINGRYVKDRVISAGLSEGYRSVLPHGVYPVAFIFLGLPPEEVDVNVHPAKTEVRFRRGEAVKELIARAVKSSLSGAGIGTPTARRFEQNQAQTGRFENADGLESGAPDESTPIQADLEFPQSAEYRYEFREELRARSAPSDASDNFSEAPMDLQPAEHAVTYRNESVYEIDHVDRPSVDPLPPVDSASSIPRAKDVGDIDSSTIVPIGQLHESFIIASDREGLLLIDQHVAHERILFDEFRRRLESREPRSQRLLLPHVMDISPAQAVILEEIRSELESHGFSFNTLSGRSIAITAVPAEFDAEEQTNLFGEILETFGSMRKGSARRALRDDVAASLACKAAVKINMKLTPEKMRWMIDRLVLTDSPSTCPHGRPVVLRLTMKDIERRFHRS